MATPRFERLSIWRESAPDEMERRARAFYEDMRRRRTVRYFSERPVPRGVIEHCLRAALTAPSGANMQPWHFVVVSDTSTKRRIREAAEIEEKEFYEKRAPKEWLDALAALGTDWHKPFLETAPHLIAIMVITRLRPLSVGRSVAIVTMAITLCLRASAPRRGA